LNLHKKVPHGHTGGNNDFITASNKEGFFGFHMGHKGDILMSVLKGTGRKRSSVTEVTHTDAIGNQEIGSHSGRMTKLLAQAEADAEHKGYLEIRRHRVLGKAWIRVYCILTKEGVFHVFQHVPSSHHALDLMDYHCIDNNAKKMQVFTITPIVESPHDKHFGTNHYHFRAPAPDAKRTKEAWLVACRRVKHQVQSAKLRSPEPSGNPMERRHSLPKDFGSSSHLPVLEDVMEEDEESVEDETNDGPSEDIAS